MKPAIPHATTLSHLPVNSTTLWLGTSVSELATADDWAAEVALASSRTPMRTPKRIGHAGRSSGKRPSQARWAPTIPLPLVAQALQQIL